MFKLCNKAHCYITQRPYHPYSRYSDSGHVVTVGGVVGKHGLFLPHRVAQMMTTDIFQSACSGATRIANDFSCFYVI